MKPVAIAVLMFIAIGNPLQSAAQKLLSGQKFKVEKQIISDLKSIDSLFRQIGFYFDDYIEIDFEKGKLFLESHGPYVEHERLVTTMRDTIKIFPLDTIRIREYCVKSGNDYKIILHVFQLMIKNKFTSISYSGPGDCLDCSLTIRFDKTKAWITQEKDNRCLPDDCFDDWIPEKVTKISKYISLAEYFNFEPFCNYLEQEKFDSCLVLLNEYIKLRQDNFQEKYTGYAHLAAWTLLRKLSQLNCQILDTNYGHCINRNSSPLFYDDFILKVNGTDTLIYKLRYSISKKSKAISLTKVDKIEYP